METSLALQRNLIAFLEEYMWDLWEKEEIYEYTKNNYDMVRKMAFDFRERVVNDKYISENFKKKILEYNMSL